MSTERAIAVRLTGLATLISAALAASLTGCSGEPAPESLVSAATADRGRLPAEPTPAARPEPTSQSRPEPRTIWFRDASESSGIDFVHTSGDDEKKYFPTANGSGVAMLDFDGDGLLDLYFASTRELPLDSPSNAMGNRLYRNLGDGRFEDASDAAGVAFRGFCHGVVSGDFDGDGTPDLYLANLGPNVLYLNNGDGTFRNASDGSGANLDGWHSGAAPLDFDNDGHLDLYVTRYGRWTDQDAETFCGDRAKGVRTYCSPLTIVTDRDFLLRNRGDGTFEDVTESAGILRTDGRGLGVVSADLNGDTLTDLYVANDLSPNFLFLNRGDGTFDDVGEDSGAARSGSGVNQAGMGVDAEDLDGDGLPELFVTNFRGEHNTLYRNFSGTHFQDSSAAAGIYADSLPEVSWACALADFDNDGEPDMFVLSGHVDNNLAQLGRNEPHAQPTKVWRNQGNAKYRQVGDPGPYFAEPHVGRGAAFGDLDNDGDLDVVVNLMNRGPAILINESVRGNWIGLELIGSTSNRSAIGAAAAIHLGDRVLHRQVKGGGSYLSSNDHRILAGIGDAEQVDRVVVRWPGGGETVLETLEAGRFHRIVEGQPDDAPAEDPEPTP
ncbi:CRTAC1 family protein [Tautonia rosea]|uniref:CRTAC1 family protein n=1 Tax=Tautonia rosea TaxID=2728037 RepID=UPI001472C022|nr:CRTAC1 family protein [Tautonia rosea]